MSTHSLHDLNDMTAAARDYLLEALVEEEANLGATTDELRVAEAQFKAQQRKVATLRAARLVLEGSEGSA